MLIEQGKLIATMGQQIKSISGWSKQTLDQVKKTNGRVTALETSVAVVNLKQKECPARQFHKTYNRKEIMYMIALILVAIVTSWLTSYWTTRGVPLG